VIAEGIKITPPKSLPVPNFTDLKKDYTPENAVAEHTCLRWQRTLEVIWRSQNLHASMGIYYLGLLSAKASKDILKAGFKVGTNSSKRATRHERASQGDGAGGGPTYSS
jgi:hypothetical protein